MSVVSSGCLVGPLLGAIAEGRPVGIPLAVVGINPEAVVEMGSTRIVEGIYGCVTSNDVVMTGMLVTPASGGRLVVSLVVVDASEVGRVMVVDGTGGTVLLPVGTELLPGTDPGKEVGGVLSGGWLILVVELVPVPGIDVLPGGGDVIVLSVDEMVEFVTGGRPGSLTLVLSDTGGSVTVGSDTVDGAAVVETPVPGPVIPSVGPRTEVEVGVAGAVAFGDGSKMLEMTESISLKRELSGLPGSELLALVVTMPVGASRIPDVLVVSSGAAGLLVDVGSSSAMLLVLLPGSGGTTVEEGCSGSGVEVSLAELSSGVLVLPGAVSVEEASSDELSVVDVSSDELSLVEVLRTGVLVDEETLDELSLVEVLSDGSLVLLSDELSLEDTLRDTLLDALSLSVVEVESEVGVGKGGETITVTGTTMVVTLESLDESESELDCLLVVSNEVDGATLSCDVVVPLLSCRLTWRGK